jgi:hypothetical protein
MIEILVDLLCCMIPVINTNNHWIENYMNLVVEKFIVLNYNLTISWPSYLT